MAQFPKKSIETKTAKTVLITLVDKNVPEYTFQGEWTGRDIQVIGRTIGRAYKREQLAKRRTLTPVETSDQPVSPTTMEELV